MSSATGLTVRQHERSQLELEMEFEVAEAHRAQVRFSATSAARERHVVRGQATDISPGGIGFLTMQYLPRLTAGVVRVFHPQARRAAADGTPIHEIAFEHRVTVRRVWMEGHEPTYAVGASFIDPGPGLDAQVAEVMRLAQMPPADGAPGDA